ncbi:hypothetical protein AAJ76_1900046273 [Vairimorpha ceranae]|uniref:Uncharacterized protein n=1 Tax=Vairimorpha ceranae TaxID=40302 RepID=A0A0F9WRH9_9MICR|nr:hypothetical protein AAJ76_1900046273 [Vairimorpha ceranae]KAF5139720.1 hypothetical protein G9O61_00g021030 [Vairimorpha ceranae]KKO75513.1 hypothetical protein AAJ76_1900046273 [Vairimorpha ceranae]
MQYTIKEHEMKKKNYKTPIDFIEDYIIMYSKQAKVPYKLYFKNLEYSKIYEISLFNYLVETKIENYQILENLLKKMVVMQWCDHTFYNLTLSIFIKGVAIALDKVIQQVEVLDFTNVNFLYFYSNANINLYFVMALKIVNCLHITKENKNREIKLKILDTFWFLLVKCYKDIENINRALTSYNQSQFINNEELKKRVFIPEILLGSKRIDIYERKQLMSCILQEIKIKAQKMCTEKLYIFIVNLISELIIREICDESELVDFHEYSRDLLDQ